MLKICKHVRLFKQTLKCFQQINVKKCPSSIRCGDANPRPSEHESPPITTSPGLPPVLSVPLFAPIEVGISTNEERLTPAIFIAPLNKAVSQ